VIKTPNFSSLFAVQNLFLLIFKSLRIISVKISPQYTAIVNINIFGIKITDIASHINNNIVIFDNPMLT